MFKITLLALALTLSTFTFAQGQRGQRGGARSQEVSIPESVLRQNIPLDEAKLNTLVNDFKLMRSVNLPLEAMSELKLSTLQKKNLSDLGAEFQGKFREAMRSQNRDQLVSLRSDLLNKVMTLLNEDQKKVVAKYMNSENSKGNRGTRGDRSKLPM
jgi:hypothetical protein